MTKGITIIIPTMWYHPDLLLSMLLEYEKCDKVKEVIIINNREEGRIALPGNKTTVIGDGTNMFVNPAWNLGVRKAKTKKVILANDDIWIKDVSKLISNMDCLLIPGKVIGLHPRSFEINGKPLHSDRTTGMGYGFGVFMGICKRSYIPIAKEFKVWYGDAIQWEFNTPLTLFHVIVTEMGGTSKKLNLTKERKEERIAWNNFISK